MACSGMLPSAPGSKPALQACRSHQLSPITGGRLRPGLNEAARGSGTRRTLSPPQTCGNQSSDRRDGARLYEPAEQAGRLAAARTAAHGMPFWINARTDVFLGGTSRIDDALERSAACAAAGADSLFVPGLVDPGNP